MTRATAQNSHILTERIGAASARYIDIEADMISTRSRIYMRCMGSIGRRISPVTEVKDMMGGAVSIFGAEGHTVTACAGVGPAPADIAGSATGHCNILTERIGAAAGDIFMQANAVSARSGIGMRSMGGVCRSIAAIAEAPKVMRSSACI